MIRSRLLLATSILMLSGCSTYSFAPPEVSLTHRGAGRQASQECLIPAGSGTALGENVDGALALIDNFIDSYRCTMGLAADGRQAWQLPGFIALAGSATAVALGGGANWAIAGGAANQLFTAGNSYYDSQEQALVLRDALEALSCIQMEAVGMSAFSRMPRASAAVAEERVNAAEARVEGAEANRQAAELVVAQRDEEAVAALNFASQASAQPLTADASGVASAQAARAQAQAQVTETRAAMFSARTRLANAGTALADARERLAEARAQAEVSAIEVTPERQYFRMVSSALLGVEVAAAQRLSQRGTYDAEGVRARIADLVEEEEENSEIANNTQLPGGSAAMFAGEMGAAAADVAIQRVIWAQVQLNVLQPKLQQCILRAQV